MLAAEAGKIRLVRLARGVRVDRRPFGAAVERALDSQPFDGVTGVTCAGFGHRARIDVGDAASQRHRLRTGIETHESFERMRAARLSNLATQRLDETQL